MSTSGILLFAHGARDPAWARPFEAVAQQLHTKVPADRVVLAFLEFMAPNLIDGGAQLVAAGCNAVTVVPLFLGAGGHVRKDLPVLLSQLRAQHPQVQWLLAPAVGESPALVQAMADIAWQASQPSTPHAAQP